MPILELDRERPVVVRGVVTLLEDFAVIQDEDLGIYVVGALQPTADPGEASPLPLGPGALVEIEGSIAAGGYSPNIVSRKLRVLAEGHLPAPPAADMGRLFSGLDNGRRVALRGVVQEVSERRASKGEWWLFVVESDSRHLLVQASKRLFPRRPDHLVDAEVEIAGIVGDSRNSRGEFIAPGITIARTDDLVVLSEPAADPFSIRPVPLAAIARIGVRPHAAPRMRSPQPIATRLWCRASSSKNAMARAVCRPVETAGAVPHLRQRDRFSGIARQPFAVCRDRR